MKKTETPQEKQLHNIIVALRALVREAKLDPIVALKMIARVIPDNDSE